MLTSNTSTNSLQVCSITSCPGGDAFYKFPPNQKLRSEWVEFSGEPQCENDYLCDKHFDVTCYTRVRGRVILKPNSVPTINPPTKEMDPKTYLGTTDSSSAYSRTVSQPSFSTSGTSCSEALFGHSYAMNDVTSMKRKVEELEEELERLRNAMKLEKQKNRRLTDKLESLTLQVERQNVDSSNPQKIIIAHITL